MHSDAVSAEISNASNVFIEMVGRKTSSRSRPPVTPNWEIQVWTRPKHWGIPAVNNQDLFYETALLSEGPGLVLRQLGRKLLFSSSTPDASHSCSGLQRSHDFGIRAWGLLCLHTCSEQPIPLCSSLRGREWWSQEAELSKDFYLVSGFCKHSTEIPSQQHLLFTSRSQSPGCCVLCLLTREPLSLGSYSLLHCPPHCLNIQYKYWLSAIMAYTVM